MTKQITETQPIADATDAELAKKVQLFLSGNRRGLSRIDVCAEQGTVKLSGTVWSFFLRQMAISLAKKVAGVRHVVDNLVVDTETMEPRTP